jgi:F0F1-type ATP synthase membrane subunit b/b'
MYVKQRYTNVYIKDLDFDEIETKSNEENDIMTVIENAGINLRRQMGIKNPTIDDLIAFTNFDVFQDILFSFSRSRVYYSKIWGFTVDIQNNTRYVTNLLKGLTTEALEKKETFGKIYSQFLDVIKSQKEKNDFIENFRKRFSSEIERVSKAMIEPISEQANVILKVHDDFIGYLEKLVELEEKKYGVETSGISDNLYKNIKMKFDENKLNEEDVEELLALYGQRLEEARKDLQLRIESSINDLDIKIKEISNLYNKIMEEFKDQLNSAIENFKKEISERYNIDIKELDFLPTVPEFVVELPEYFVNELKKEFKILISNLDEEDTKRKIEMGSAATTALRLAFLLNPWVALPFVPYGLNKLLTSHPKDDVKKYIYEAYRNKARLQLEIEEKLRNLEKMINKQIKNVINKLENEAEEKYKQFLNTIEKPASKVEEFLKQEKDKHEAILAFLNYIEPDILNFEKKFLEIVKV